MKLHKAMSGLLKKSLLHALLSLQALVGVTTVNAAETPAVKERQIIICTSRDASPAIKAAADQLYRDAKSVPIFNALIATQGAGDVIRLDSEELMEGAFPRKFNVAYQRAAFNHIMIVGLRSQDPLLDKVWGHNAAIDETKKTLFREGYGYLQGDIGFVESDRNPFLYSLTIPLDCFTFNTTLLRCSGTSEAGVLEAVKQFKSGLMNGFVPAGKITRTRETLLDLDPSATPPPGSFPTELPGGLHYAGWHQPPENEYRAYLDNSGYEPKQLWRLKYLNPKGMEVISNEAAMAFDGDPNTYSFFKESNDVWLGLDLGAPETITKITFRPRKVPTSQVSGWDDYMAYGYFEGSDSADFSDAIELYKITEAPKMGAHTVDVDATAPIRYVRYVSPRSGHACVAEIAFFSGDKELDGEIIHQGNAQLGILDIEQWLNGVHRIAYRNALNIIEFANESEAAETLKRITSKPSSTFKGKPFKKMELSGTDVWSTDQPIDDILLESLGKCYIWQKQNYLMMSALPEDATAALIR